MGNDRSTNDNGETSKPYNDNGNKPNTNHEAARLDRADSLAPFRDRFAVPDGEYYMDGNSLGLLSIDAEAAVERVVEQWRTLAVRGWDQADPSWFTVGERLGDRIAPLVGARGDEVVVGNSTTTNIHALLGTVYSGAGAVLVNDLDFPTDHYAIRATLRRAGRDPEEYLHVVESRDDRTIDEERVVEAIDEARVSRGPDVEVLFFPSVFYRSGQLLDIEYLTEQAHDRGVLAGFDLAHSVGVVPHDLAKRGVDFAVWCSYKYLNGGPGAPAGLYVNRGEFDRTPALSGWWGSDKATQFEMNQQFRPAGDAGAYQIGTPPLLAMAGLDGALSVVENAGIEAIREKSLSLTDYLIDRIDQDVATYGCTIGTPRDHDRRGGHVAVEHPEANRISRALRERGVIVDYRPPNVVRVCPSPLYTSYTDVEGVVSAFESVLADREFERFEKTTDGVT